MSSGVYVWVEGEDDERFVRQILERYLENKYAWVKLVQYARQSTRWKLNFLRSIRGIGAACLFIADLDVMPCVRRRKEKIIGELGLLRPEEICVVIREIEGWYLAGVVGEPMRRMGLAVGGATDELTKEEFNAMVPELFKSRRDFMVELLKEYAVDNARGRSRSLEYLFRKYGLA